MTIQEPAPVDLSTPYGPMRTYILRPAAAGRYPGLVLYSEIFQVTAPVHRMAAILAGHGFIVAVPEIFHEQEGTPGVVLPYDTPGADRGNSHKFTKELASYDADARAALDHLASRDDCTGKLGVMGICIGGHLAFRAAMNPDVVATACFYPTDIHSGTLGRGKKDDSMARAVDIKGELLMLFGRQDPHIPDEGRRAIYERLREVGARFQWHEVNGAHAFLRDEGPRYDPALAFQCYGLALELFHRKLGPGDVRD
jgi:carboxymethylenebutenolidase